MTSRFQVVPAAYVLPLRPAGTGTEVLLQLRRGTGYRDGHWAAGAAGHVEEGESVWAAAVREAREELGIDVDRDDLQPLTTMHRTHGNGRPIDERVDFFFACRRWRGTPARLETDKSAELAWFDLDALPSPVVPHELVVLEGLRSGRLEPVTSFGFPRDG